MATRSLQEADWSASLLAPASALELSADSRCLALAARNSIPRCELGDIIKGCYAGRSLTAFRLSESVQAGRVTW